MIWKMKPDGITVKFYICLLKDREGIVNLDLSQLKRETLFLFVIVKEFRVKPFEVVLNRDKATETNKKVWQFF